MESLLRELLPPPAPSSAGESDEPHPQDGRVLVIDDDRAVREMFRRSLELARFDVVVVSGGAEALRVLREDPAIRLVLLDLVMPGMDGHEFRRRQRADARLAAIPTVVVTGSALAQIVHAELMAVDYLLKPVAREHLVSVVARYCNPADRATPSQAHASL